MTIRDYRLLEAVTKLIEVKTVVEQDIGEGELSQQLKECIDTLDAIVRIQTWVK